MKGYKILNSGNFVPYKDYTSTSAIQMTSTSADPLSLKDYSLVLFANEQITMVEYAFEYEDASR